MILKLWPLTSKSCSQTLVCPCERYSASTVYLYGTVVDTFGLLYCSNIFNDFHIMPIRIQNCKTDVVYAKDLRVITKRVISHFKRDLTVMAKILMSLQRDFSVFAKTYL